MADVNAILTSKQGALWIQPNGFNTTLYYLGCHALGSVSAPKGSLTLKQCFDEDQKYETRGLVRSAPGLITGQVTAETEMIQSILDQVEESGCPFALYVNSVLCNRKLNVFENYGRGFVLQHAELSQVDDNNAQHHEEDGFYNQTYAIEAIPERNRYYTLTIQREETGEVQNANDIAFCDQQVCMSGCTTPQDPGDTLYVAHDSDGVGGTANITISTDGGTTWAALAADPFAANADIMSIICVQKDEDTVRVIAAMEAPAGGQGMIAYADNPTAAAAVWTTVNIGGGAAGHGAVYHKALFARSPTKIYLASEAGYIYYSEDYGATWTAQESGTISANGYRQIKFYDDSHGVAVNDTGGVVAVTHNGGTTWAASGAVVTGALALNTVEMVDEHYIWVGTATGLLFYSDDMGDTWNPRIDWAGSGVGQIRDLYANDPYNIWMTKDTADPIGSVLKTVNGGVNWKVVPDIFTNVGLNAIVAPRDNNAICVGLAQGGTAVIGDIDPATS
jgi:photosystem II stability/assembly factor-like uncharacterized protein